MDHRLLGALAETTRPNVLDLSRRLGVARNTVQARLDRLQRAGVISGYGPNVHLDALGIDVLAFATLEIAQDRGDSVLAGLTAIAEVLEVHQITGPGDLLCRIVARSNEDLHRVLDEILALPGITRTSTALVLHTPLSRVQPTADAVGALIADDQSDSK